MTIEEMSNQFDVHYNNITSNQAPGLDEYEKSVFLTKAQNELVKAYFSPALNKTQNGFDDSPIRQADFSTIISNCTLSKIINPTNPLKCFDKRAIAYELPADLFISLNEQLFSGLAPYTVPYTVVPITFIDYNRLMSKPYKYPLKYQAWRMITKNLIVDSVDIVKKYITIGEQKDQYSITIASNCGKKIRFSVMVVSKNSNSGTPKPPKIREYTDSVTIDCDIPQGFSMATYFSYFLNGQSEINNYNELMKYVKPFSGQKNESLWPAFIIPENTPIKTLAYIENNGGTPPHQASIAEIVGRFNDPENLEYNIRYIRKLKPIILVDLADIDNELSIEGYHEPMESELPSELHEDILQRAVELAKAAYSGTLQDTISLGAVSGTEKGIVTRQQ